MAIHWLRRETRNQTFIWTLSLRSCGERDFCWLRHVGQDAGSPRKLVCSPQSHLSVSASLPVRFDFPVAPSSAFSAIAAHETALTSGSTPAPEVDGVPVSFREIWVLEGLTMYFSCQKQKDRTLQYFSHLPPCPFQIPHQGL